MLTKLKGKKIQSKHEHTHKSTETKPMENSKTDEAHIISNREWKKPTQRIQTVLVESMFNVETSTSLCDSSILFFVQVEVSNTVAVISQSPIAISRTFTHFLFVCLRIRSFLCVQLVHLKRKTCTHKSRQTNKKKMKQKCNSQVLLRCKNCCWYSYHCLPFLSCLHTQTHVDVLLEFLYQVFTVKQRARIVMHAYMRSQCNVNQLHNTC